MIITTSRECEFASIGDAVSGKFNSPDKWTLLRKMYAMYMPAIMKSGNHGIDPYFTDWPSLFTPIEMEAWQSIRCYGVPMYPQFPVLNYFLDFANPVKRIGLEMDGAKWHDKDRDRKRDARLLEHGWTIFRVPGREAYTRYEDPFDDYTDVTDDEREQNIHRWIMESCDGVVFSIKEVYFGELVSKWHSLATKSLEKHCSFGGVPCAL